MKFAEKTAKVLPVDRVWPMKFAEKTAKVEGKRAVQSIESAVELPT